MANVVTCGNFAVKQWGSNEENGLGNLLGIVRCTTSAPQKAPNFSWTFALASPKGEHVAKTLPKILLNVVQDGDSLEIVESFG